MRNCMTCGSNLPDDYFHSNCFMCRLVESENQLASKIAIKRVETLAVLAEREACANLCEEYAESFKGENGWEGHLKTAASTCFECAQLIRGQT